MSSIYHHSSGHEDLFKKLCDHAGIPCLIVGGPVRTGSYEPGQKLDGKRNRWNLVFCGQGWRVIDCHWGCCQSNSAEISPKWVRIDSDMTGRSSRSDINTECMTPSKTVYEFDDYYFLPDPEELKYSHFADAEMYQLLDHPIGFEEFRKQALLSSSFFKLGLHLKSHFKIITSHREDEVKLQFALAMKTHLYFTYELYINHRGKSSRRINNIPLNKFVFGQSENKIVSFTIRVPIRGYYKLDICGGVYNRDDFINNKITLSQICSFFFKCKQAGDSPQPLPADAPSQFGPSAEMEFMGLEPTTHKTGIVPTDKSGFAEIRLKMKKSCEFICNLFSIDFSYEQLESFVFHRPVGSERVFHVRCPKSGEYVLQFYAKHSSDVSNPYTYIFSYLIVYKNTLESLESPKRSLTSRWPVTQISGSLGPRPETTSKFNIRAKVDDFLLYADELSQFEIDLEFKSSICFELICSNEERKTVANEFFFIENKKNSATIYGRLPNPGYFLLQVYVKLPDWLNDSYVQAFGFLIYARSCRINQITFPKLLPDWSDESTLIFPNRGQLEPNSETLFKLIYPGATDVAINVGNRRVYLDQDEPEGTWSRVVNSGPGGQSLRLSVRSGDPGSLFTPVCEFQVLQTEIWNDLVEHEKLVNDDYPEALNTEDNSEDISSPRSPKFVFQDEEESKHLAEKIDATAKEILNKIYEIESLGNQTLMTKKFQEKLKLQQKIRETETKVKNLKEENVRSKMRLALMKQDKELIQLAMEDFRDKNVPDLYDDYFKAEQILVFFKVKDDLINSLSSNQPQVIQNTINAVTLHGFENDLQDILEEARKEIARLQKFVKLRHEIMDLNQQALAEVKSYKEPKPAVFDIFYATYRLLGESKTNLNDWASISGLLGKLGKDNIRRRIVNFTSSDVGPELMQEVRAILSKYSLDELKVTSVAVAAFYVWAMGVVENEIA